MRSFIAFAALAAALLVSPVMAATTTTILAPASYNGAHAGGPFAIPAGTSEIEIDANISDAPPGANFTIEGDTSSDGGATWQMRVVFNCPGGTVIPKGGTVAVDQSCSTQLGIDLDPAKTYLARFAESSQQPVTASATITIF